jgi:hypothetical protein
MIHEHLHERSAMKVRQSRYFSDYAYMPKPLDGFAIFSILIADQHHPWIEFAALRLSSVSSV